MPSFRFCCPKIIAPNVPPNKCMAPQDELSTCEDLIGERVLRALLWVISLVAVFGNGLVIVYRVLIENHAHKSVFRIFVGHLSVSDLLMGVYLLIIAVMDAEFRDKYVLYEKQWRSSDWCKAAGFLSMMSSETSAVLIFLITLDRFFVMKYPYGQYRFTKVTAHLSCGIAWFIGFSLALIPLLPLLTHWSVYQTNGMCVGIPLSTLRLPGWHYSVAVFIGFNSVLFILIALGQGAIYRSFSQRSSRTLRNSCSSTMRQINRRKQEVAVAKRLSLIIVSDCLCFLPICIMGLLVLAGHDVGNEAYRWSAVVVLPINSALNPLLYSLGTIKEHCLGWRAWKGCRGWKGWRGWRGWSRYGRTDNISLSLTQRSSACRADDKHVHETSTSV